MARPVRRPEGQNGGIAAKTMGLERHLRAAGAEIVTV
jgi:hypothetical protein